MLYFSKWKIVAILLTVLTGIVFAVPNLLSEEQAKKIPNWLPHYQMTLGLDLKGGAHLLMQVDEEKLITERLDALREDVRVKLREANVRGRARTVDERAVEVTLREPTSENI
ncbi:MAG: protein translocase subunit SecDF, partial [Pseudomonadota bacterium]